LVNQSASIKSKKANINNPKTSFADEKSIIGFSFRMGYFVPNQLSKNIETMNGIREYIISFFVGIILY